MPRRRRTLRQYEHDPTRPAYYTKRGLSHGQAIRAAQGERKQRGLPGLGYQLYYVEKRGRRPRPTADPKDVNAFFGDQPKFGPQRPTVLTRRPVQEPTPSRPAPESSHEWHGVSARPHYTPKGVVEDGRIYTGSRWRPLTKRERKTRAQYQAKHAHDKDAGVDIFAKSHPKEAGFAPAAAAVGKVVQRTGSQVVTGIAGQPAGIVAAGKAIGEDIRDTATGHPTIKRTFGLGKAMVHQTIEDITHPYERPGYLLLDALAAASTGAGAATRIGLLGKAISRGDLGEFGVLGTAQRVRAAAQAGRMYTLRYGDGGTEHVLLSKNAMRRGMQRKRLERQQAQLDEGAMSTVPTRGPLKGARYTVTREFAPQATIGRVRRTRGRTMQHLANAPVIRADPHLRWVYRRLRTTNGKITYKLDRGRDLAVGLAGVFGHEALANPGAVVNRFVTRHAEDLRQLRQELAETTGTTKRDRTRRKQIQGDIKDVTADLEAAPAVRHLLIQKPPELLNAIEHSRNLSHLTGAEGKKYGTITDLTEKGRRGAIHAAYDPQAQGMLARRNHLRSIRDDDLSKLSESDVQKRLAQIRDDLEANLSDQSQYRPAGPYEAAAGQRFRLGKANQGDIFYNQEGQSFSKSVIDATRAHDKLEYRNLYEGDKVVGTIAFDARPVRGKVYVESIYIDPAYRGDISTLRHLAQPVIEKLAGRKIDADFLNAKLGRVFQRMVESGRLERTVGDKGQKSLGRAPDATLRGLRQQEHQLREAVAKINDEVELRGINQKLADRAPDGSFFFSTAERYHHPTSEMTGKPYAPRPSTAGLARPTPGRHVPGLTKEFTGTGLRRGLPKVTQAITDRYHRVQRMATALDNYDELWRASTPDRRSEFDIPLREDATPQHVRRVMSDLAHEIDSAEGNRIPDSVMEQFKRDAGLDIDPRSVTTRVGDAEDGIRWVDSRYIKDLTGKAGRGGLTGMFDTINNPARLATLYLRPAYALNALGNVAMAAVTQGYLAPINLMRGVKSVKMYGRTIDSEVTAVMGEGRSLAQAVETGALGQATHRLATGWNKATDSWFRKASFYFHAADEGFKGRAGLERLFQKDANGDYVNADKIHQISQYANKDAVDFTSLTPTEMDTIRHIIYFYPWVSRGSAWVGRAMLEHPVKMAVATKLGQQAQEEFPGFYANLPNWARQAGLVPLTRGQTPLTINPSSVWTPMTASQTAAQLTDLGKGLAGLKQTGSFGEALTPGAELLATLAGADTGGKAPGLLGAAQSLPQVAALGRMGIGPDWLVPKPGKTYPERGVKAGLLPLVTGGLTPRRTSQPTLGQQKKKEVRAGMSKSERATADVATDQSNLTKDARRLGRGLSPELKRAFKLRSARKSNLASLDSKAPDYQRQALQKDLDLMVEWGASQEWADRVKKASEKWTTRQVRRVRLLWGDKVFGGETISTAKSAVHDALDAKHLEPSK